MSLDFTGKKVAVLGGGTEGLSTIEYLLGQGALVTLCDRKTKEELAEYAELQAKGVSFSLGVDHLANLTGYDYYFRSPGFSINLPELKQLAASGVNILSQTKLFFAECPCPIIGVTGTKGKGTTSTLIHKIISTHGQYNAVYLAGNIGLPALDLLSKLTAEDAVVLELSSFQLQDLDLSPHIAVVLNVTQEHLDYHASVAEYVEAKSQIVRFQQASDFAVINMDYETSADFVRLTKAQVYGFSRHAELAQGCFVKDGQITWRQNGQTVVVALTNKLTLRGEHNWENVCAAIAASVLAGVDPAAIAETVTSFPGLEHRLEFVREVAGVKYYNDSFGTTPETAIAAISAFTEPKVLVLGGSDKGSNYSELAQAVKNSNTKAVILIGTVAPTIKQELLQAGCTVDLVEGLTTMSDIVKAAASIALAGDVVLLSPACASFGLFKNYKDRGQQFKEQVQKL